MVRAIAAALLLVVCSGQADAATKATGAGAQQPRKPDLADFVEGTYRGDVISDARGSSQSGVTVTVRRIGKNLVEVSCDYKRVPTVQIPIEQAMSSIVQARGNAVFVMDRAKDDKALDLTIDDASLSVRR